jgi:pimeloyl-ACP methyl ester carboxylesterase
VTALTAGRETDGVRLGSEGYARDDAGWRRLQPLLPALLRLQARYAPRGRWLPVGRFTVRLDRHGDDQAPACVVLVHGAGGNGRLLACYGQMAAAAGFAAVAPDLPGYGVTRTPGKRRLVYEDWRRGRGGVGES